MNDAKSGSVAELSAADMKNHNVEAPSTRQWMSVFSVALVGGLIVDGYGLAPALFFWRSSGGVRGVGHGHLRPGP
jgi:hypothetical protein